MKLNDGDGVSFCKILLSDSVDYLPLPPDFANKYLQKGNSKKQTLVLNMKSGVKWSVKYSEIEDRYYFMDGWLKFMKDNHVQKGDILVFWLLSPSPKSVFQVFLYAPNGCLKHPTTCSGAGAGASGVKGNKRLKKALIIKEDSSDVDPSDNDPSDDDSSDEDSRGNGQQSLTRILRKSYIHTMPMTKSFVNATGISGYSSLRLKNDDGKMWEVKVRKYSRQQIPYMTEGWLDFCVNNKMQIGDTCEFNHVKANILRVHVFKKKGRPFNKNRSN